MKKKAPVNLVCFGDSVTEVSGEPEGSKWPTRLQFALDTWQPGGYRVFNRGVSGNTSAQGLERIDAQVLPFLPGWVVVAFGGNDANVRPHRHTPRVGLREFESNLAEIHRLITCAGGKPAYMAIHLPLPDERTKAQGRKYDQGNGRTYAENFAPYRQALLRLARKHGAPSLDLEAALKKASLTAAHLVCSDGIHLTTDGNAFYGETIFAWLKTVLER